MLPTFALEGEFWLGTSKASLKSQSMEVPRTIRQAMMLSCGGIMKYTRIILVRDGRCLVINGGKDLDVVREFPILPGDQIQKYDENDLKEWKLPVIEGTDAVALLVESEKQRASEPKEESEEPQQVVPAANPSLEDFETPISPIAGVVSGQNATTLAADGTSTSTTPWNLIVVLIVAATGLLWLLVKNRK